MEKIATEESETEIFYPDPDPLRRVKSMPCMYARTFNLALYLLILLALPIMIFSFHSYWWSSGTATW